MLGSLVAARADTAETKVALVVGNSKYVAAEELSNPGNDAVAVAAALGKIGFKVTVRTDIGEQDFETSLKEFARDATKSDVALFYFAGHGVQYADENYFLPVDTKLADINDIEFDTVSMDLVVKAASKARKTKIIILDACRADPTHHGHVASRSLPELGVTAGFASLHTISNADGLIIFYSAEAGKEALDGQGSQNSPFAQSFVAHIVDPNAKIRDVFGLVQNEVYASTKQTQHPQIALDELTTNVILNPTETAEDAWLRIHRSNSANNPVTLRQFIKDFPDTPQADDAQTRLDYLESKQRDEERDAAEKAKKAEEEKAKQKQAELEEERRKKLAAEQDRLIKEKAEKEAHDKAEAEKRAQIEADRKADEERIAEDKRKLGAAAAEHTRVALEKAAMADAEAKRLAKEAAAAKQKLAAEADAAAKEEEQRKADEAVRKAAEAAEEAKKEDEKQKQQAMLEDQERKKNAAEAAAKVVADACARDQARIAELKDAGDSAAIQKLGAQSLCPAAPAAASQAIKDVAANQAKLCAADQKNLSSVDQRNEDALKAALIDLKCDSVRDKASQQIAKLDAENLKSAQICAEDHARLASIDLFVQDSRANLSALKRSSQCAPLGAEIDSAIAELDKRVATAQKELQRVGCYLPKEISGRFDAPTLRALTDYLTARHATNIGAPSVTAGFVEELASQDFVVCSAPVIPVAPNTRTAPTASVSPSESPPAPARQRVWARPEPQPARIPLITQQRRNDTESGPSRPSVRHQFVQAPLSASRPAAAPKPAAPLPIGTSF